jgi:hypothetical protein
MRICLSNCSFLSISSPARARPHPSLPAPCSFHNKQGLHGFPDVDREVSLDPHSQTMATPLLPRPSQALLEGDTALPTEATDAAD